MSFLIPPFQKPDEFAHFKKIVSLSNFDLFCQKKKQPINPNLYQVVTSPQIGSIPFNYYGKMALSLYKTPAVKGENRLLDVEDGCRYQDIVGYTIPVIFYKLLSSIFLPINGFILFGLMRFLIFVFCYGFLIIRVLKTKNDFIKKTTFFVLTLPMTINQFSAFSYDVGHLFFGIIFTCLFFDFLETRKAKKKSLVYLLVSFFLFVFSKPLYDLFFLLFFLIPKEKLAQIKIRKNWLLFLIFVVLVILRLLHYEKTGVLLGIYYPRLQKDILLENPWRFFSILEKTYFDSFQFYVKSLIGILGWLDFELDFFVYLFFIVVFGYLVGTNLKKVKVNFFQASVYFFLLTGSLFVFLLSEFFYWTSPGSATIAGVQGRYLIVFLPYLALVLIFVIKNFILSFILIIFFLILLISRSIYYRYYDYSVYAKPTSNLLTSKKKYVLVKAKSEKIFPIENRFTGACYGVFLKFKNKKFDAPIKVEIFDKKNKQVVYFLKEQVNNTKEVIGVSFPKTRFKGQVYVRVINQYSLKPFFILDEAALNCIQDYWY